MSEWVDSIHAYYLIDKFKKAWYPWHAEKYRDTHSLIYFVENN